MQVNSTTVSPVRQDGVNRRVDNALLSFQPMSNNRKLAKAMRREGHERGYFGRYLAFSLPAGHSCPFAFDCKAHADRDTGRVTDGEHMLFRCYAASQEWLPSVRNSRHHNFDLLRTGSMLDKYTLIRESLIEHDAFNNSSVIRIHVSGDFFNPDYFNAWQMVASESPFNLYYAYTKALPYIAKHGQGYANLRMVASKGGTHDHLIGEHGLRYSEVVFSEYEAEWKGLAIDHDDTTAAFTDDSFALLLHGTQAKGTDAALALRELRLAVIA